MALSVPSLAGIQMRPSSAAGGMSIGTSGRAAGGTLTPASLAVLAASDAPLLETARTLITGASVVTSATAVVRPRLRQSSDVEVLLLLMCAPELGKENPDVCFGKTLLEYRRAPQ